MIQPKKHIQTLYRTPTEFGNRIGRSMRLDRNERTTPFPTAHLQAILASIKPEEVVAYPELEKFYGKLANWLGVARDEVLLTSGSDTAIRAVFEVYVDEGDEVITLSPSYGMYAVYGQMFGAVRRDIFYEADLTLRIENILQAINERTKLVALANPNHTGTVIEPDDLVRILDAAWGKKALVMVDEAYFHFCDVTMVPYVRQYDNLVIIRTFSKALGIAPLRVGYAIGQQQIIADLYKVKLTHEITGISARFGEYLLDHLEIMEEQVADVKSGIRFLERECRSLGLKTEETHANFIYIELPPDVDGKDIVASLKERNIYISGPFTKAPFHNHIRVTVGPEDQMRSFMEEFRQAFSRAQGGA